MSRKIRSREGMQKMTQNFAWLFLDKVLKMTVVMAVNIWAYRYLGPENVGIWNYAIAFVTILTPLANLGIDGIVVRDIVNNPLRKNELIGASFMVKLLGSLFMTLFAILMIYFRRPDDVQMMYYVFIIASSNVFLAFDAIDLYNQSQLKSKYTVLSKSIGYLTCAVAKVFLIVWGMSLEWFVWMQFAENAIGALFLVLWYKKSGEKISTWKLDFTTAKDLLSQSWPLILTAGMMFVQQNIDQIFLGDWVSEYELGQFSTAAKLIALFGFIPMIIQSTVAPELAKAKSHSNALFMLKMNKVYQIMFVVSVSLIAFCVFFGKWIVVLLYGQEYVQAGALMALMSIRLVFVNYGVAKALYITNFNLFRYFLLTGVVGATINVALNFYLIPIYESTGAIWASIFSLLISIIIIDLFNPYTRQNFRSMMNSFFNIPSYFDVFKGK
ncbi:MAG: flippase [Bacteroidales bacterium]|nr:flippase [Bacteroidales bacterium]MDD4576456.1 flippase [Bacteroidales bacterium]